MADSIREKIMKNIQTTLQGITIANGYATELQNVQRFFQIGQSSIPLPAVGLLEGDDNVDSEGPLAGTSSLVSRTLNVGLVVKARQDAAIDAMSASEFMNILIADIQKAMQVDYQRGGYATDTSETAISPIFPEEGQPELICEIAYSIKYRHRRTDPTQG